MHKGKVTKIPSILDQFTPDIRGIFWITKEDLNRTLAGFDDLNYLFDGLISQYIYGQDQQNLEMRSHIFFTENFGQKFFLVHIKAQGLSKPETLAEIEAKMPLAEIGKEAKKTLLVFDKTGNGWYTEMKNRHAEFEFKALDL